MKGLHDATMGKKEYIFDAVEISARKISSSLWGFTRSALRLLLVSMAVAALVYFVLSIFISTDTEKRLYRENARYSELYSGLKVRQKLISESVAALQQKDNMIYRQVFDTEAPSVDPAGSLDFLSGSDTIPDSRLVMYTADKAASLLSGARKVDGEFLRIYRMLAAEDRAVPPMDMPVDDTSYPQIGAGTGRRFNPFYRAEVDHDGLDIIAALGAPVRAAAGGVVSSVDLSRKGAGNAVEIDHGNGYVTRYEHLNEVFVSGGQRVSRGARIGSVGMTGVSFATHLHYEVLKDGVPVNPVDHFFASIGPDEYSNMLYMSQNTRQSMD